LASVWFVGKTIDKWKLSVIVTFIIGTGAALAISFLSPATQNESLWYLFICGIVAVCSMILPGLSGSFVLILLGNYQLVMVDAVKELNAKVLGPVAVGAAFGLVAFSHILSWLFKKFKDQTIALLTGFILGSLAILWPWKERFDLYGDILEVNKFGALIDKNGAVIVEEVKVSGYSQYIPESFSNEVLIAVGLMIAGFISIWLIEKFATNKTEA
jgi:putative membrane protein